MKREFDVLDFGAVGDGKTLDTKVIQSAIDACGESGGGTVALNAGTYRIGTLFMRSNVNLRIENGAKLFMSDKLEDFPDFSCEWNVKAAPRYSARCLIYVGNCENVSICGLGTIDCNGAEFCEINPNPSTSETDPFRCRRMRRKYGYEGTVGRMIFVMKSKNITLKDFTMLEMAGGWGIWVNASEQVNIHNLKLRCCPHYPNSDGIHINCSKDVFVTDCSVHSGDDALIVRANTNTLEEDVPCENVIVKGCSLSSLCNAVRIGWIGDGLIRNCVFSDLVITNSRDAIKIAIPKGSIAADLGKNVTRIERISFHNVLIDSTYRYPVSITVADSDLVRCDYVRNIEFHHLNSRTGFYPYLSGCENHYLEDISFIDCRFDVGEKAEEGFTPRCIRNLKMDCVWNVK